MVSSVSSVSKRTSSKFAFLVIFGSKRYVIYAYTLRGAKSIASRDYWDSFDSSDSVRLIDMVHGVEYVYSTYSCSWL